jgi:hypothetical protein
MKDCPKKTLEIYVAEKQQRSAPLITKYHLVSYAGLYQDIHLEQ